MKTYQRCGAIGSLLLLAACGFSPIYGKPAAVDGVPVATALNDIQIENIADRNGQMLRNKLMDRMFSRGRPGMPKARLYVSISSNESDLGIQKDATSRRTQLVVSAPFSLKDMNGNEIHTGAAYSAVSYNKLDAQYGTLATQRNAYERALNEVGEQIVNNLSLYYAQKAPFEKPKPAPAPKPAEEE